MKVSRDCYVCGQLMTKVKGGSFVECRTCDIMEDATVTGRFHSPSPAPFYWGGESITFIDHGEQHVPSPG